MNLFIPRNALTIFSDPFFSQVIQGIAETCASQGYFLMLSMVTDDINQGRFRHMLRSRHSDGVIILSSDMDDPILPLLKDRTPLVLVGSHPYFRDLSWVDAENHEGARNAVNHLIKLGHRRIATITGPLQMAVAVDRRNGYKQALLEAGMPITPELIVEGDFTQEGGYRAMARLLERMPRPTAVFIASDMMATGALHATHEAGLCVPADLAIVGFDDVPMASFVNPPLTTIRQPIYELGTIAVKLLIDQLAEHAQRPTQMRIPTQLIVRQSCGAATPQPAAS
jgi:LacI family transcriptional regulator